MARLCLLRLVHHDAYIRSVEATATSAEARALFASQGDLYAMEHTAKVR
jgi:hypothetical protein